MSDLSVRYRTVTFLVMEVSHVSILPLAYANVRENIHAIIVHTRFTELNFAILRLRSLRPSRGNELQSYKKEVLKKHFLMFFTSIIENMPDFVLSEAVPGLASLYNGGHSADGGSFHSSQTDQVSAS